MKKTFKKIKLNIKPILSMYFKFTMFLLSLFSLLLSFVTWDMLKINKLSTRIIILVSIFVFSFCIVCIIALVLKKRRIWVNGKNKMFSFYGDLWQICRKKEKKIIVIPVNDTFETIIDDDLTQVKPLVSLRTIHGKWIQFMLNNGYKKEEIDEQISNYLKSTNSKPIKIYSKSEKQRGKLESYPCGTVAAVNGPCNTTFYLLVVSTFNDKNNAKSSRKIIGNSIEDLLDFFNENGQGYPMYLPLIGTGLSDSGLTHKQSYNTIRHSILTNDSNIRGCVNIVIYNGDKDKVSIFDN